MSAVQQVANLVVRQAFGTESAQASTTGTAATPAATTNFVQVACDSENGYDGRIGVRISAIFVILLGSAIGEWMSLLTDVRRRSRRAKMIYLLYETEC